MDDRWLARVYHDGVARKAAGAEPQGLTGCRWDVQLPTGPHRGFNDHRRVTAAPLVLGSVGSGNSSFCS